jgi:hypothetical protein
VVQGLLLVTSLHPDPQGVKVQVVAGESSLHKTV